MYIEGWILLVILAVIVFFFVLNRSKQGEIEDLRRKNSGLDQEVKNLTAAISVVKANAAKEVAQKRRQYESAAQKLAEKEEALTQKHNKLMRAYMLARKKSEIEAVAEIEQAIIEDYEALGSKNLHVARYIPSAMADFYTTGIKGIEHQLEWMRQKSRSQKVGDLRKETAVLIERTKRLQYAYEAMLMAVVQENPEIDLEKINSQYGTELRDVELFQGGQRREIGWHKDTKLQEKCAELEAKCRELQQMVDDYSTFKDIRWPLLKYSIESYKKEFESNLTAIPYMSQIVADIMTVDLDRLAWSLSWGNNQERKKKVASLKSLKKETKEKIEQLKWAEYQLAYLLEVYPTLRDVIETEFKELDVSYEAITDYDPARKYIDREAWEKLSETERNQLALDRYIESRKKSNWQIGRDYELYCGHCYEKKGHVVDYYGTYHGLEDLGRDLIVRKGDEIRIVQCKYWSQSKQIHENHVMQLYGSVIEYNLENNANACGVLITNTQLSPKAKEFARVLGISYKEKMPIGEFPRIKCNIGVDEDGGKVKIYHLPFDQQYDSTKIDSEGEFMAMTVTEAEAAGFRRAYRWHGI